MNPADDTPLEGLADWIGKDHDRGLPMTEERMHELAEQSIAEGRRRRAIQDQRRRRRRVAAGIGAAVALTAGTAAAAAVLWREHPTAPQAGITCRSEADPRADAIVIEPGGDPIAVCQEQWDEGAFEEFGTYTLPDALAACVSNAGTIEVFPGTEAICAQLGLATANTEPSADTQLVVELQDRLINEINAIDCLTAEEAAASARQILNDLDLTEWPVQTNPDAVGTTCAKAGIGPDNQHVYIHKL